jgi:hypothetical protein
MASGHLLGTSALPIGPARTVLGRLGASRVGPRTYLSWTPNTRTRAPSRPYSPELAARGRDRDNPAITDSRLYDFIGLQQPDPLLTALFQPTPAVSTMCGCQRAPAHWTFLRTRDTG